VCLAGHDYSVEIGYEADEVPGLWTLELIVREVASHARTEALGLPYIEGSPVTSLPEIDTRSLGKMRQLCGNSVGHRKHV
jgi:hypothetical protein